VLVFALYINTGDVAQRYEQPQWLSCPALLYWVSRVWIKEGRGEVHDDPLMYALRDAGSYVVLAAVLLAMFLAF